MARLYVKLDVDFYDDEKIIEAGEKAEVLFVRGLCLIKKRLSDGYIADSQLARFGLSGVTARASRLVDVGLWERVDGGYLCPSWLKSNKSKDEIEAQSDRRAAASAKANHDRWHSESLRNGCPFCDPKSDPKSDAASDSTETETETETETRRRRPPSDFQPTEEHRSFAARHGLNLEGERVHWVNHCDAKGVTYVRLNSGFATWLQNAVNFGRGKPQGSNVVDFDALSRSGS